MELKINLKQLRNVEFSRVIKDFEEKKKSLSL